jgi:pimeloyl-ACP methyl ester carboxylesterase
MNETPTFLLVHGSWHGPWCWEPLQHELAKSGSESATVALPSCGMDNLLTGLAEDAETVAAAAAAIHGEVIVVGHSYGGAVISEAAHPKNVRQLVYLGAFMPDAGRPFVSYFPPGPLPAYLVLNDDGTYSAADAEAESAFYHDCAPEIASASRRRLVRQSQSVMGYAPTRAAWRAIASHYIVLTGDRIIPPFVQRDFAKQAGSVSEMPTSHSPMLSRPAELAAQLAGIAARWKDGSMDKPMRLKA